MSVSAQPLRRDPGRGWIAGVFAGVGEQLGIDPLILRIAFVVLVVVTGGLGLVGYGVAWLVIPVGEDKQGPLAKFAHIPRVRGDWRIALGVGLLTLSCLLAFRQLGIWWSDAIGWPLVAAAFGVALLWGRSRRAEEAESIDAPPPEPSEHGAATPSKPHAARASRLGDLYQGVFGVLLVIGAALLFLSSNHVLGGLRDAAVTTVVVVVALALILAPFLWRLGRNLANERAERIRSQERAELAAHLHDSVLQTLALMQKRADDPREVAALARRQERELRQWLAGDGRYTDGRFAAALRRTAEEVEDVHRAVIDVVVVGDRALDERSEPVLGAVREALVNAARHAGDAGPIRVYAEVEEDAIEVFIRDRGRGFDLASVPADRRGVRESIIGRMERAGGAAEIRRIPDGGTEVSLSVRVPETEQKGEPA
jgi:signal transduction histidine kinase/phage shock protein PspC (stress-responsive transcriptional regulator)